MTNCYSCLFVFLFFFSSKTIKLVKEFMNIDSQFRNWLVDSLSKVKSTHFHGYHFDAKLGNYERHLTTFSWNLSGKRTLTIWWKNRQFHLCPCKACVINAETKLSVSKKCYFPCRVLSLPLKFFNNKDGIICFVSSVRVAS